MLDIFCNLMHLEGIQTLPLTEPNLMFHVIQLILLLPSHYVTHGTKIRSMNILLVITRHLQLRFTKRYVDVGVLDELIDALLS